MDQRPPLDADGTISSYVSTFFQSDVSTTLVMGGIGALIAAVASVSFGFWLNKKWELKKEIDMEIYAGRNAQYSLLRQYEILYNINKNHLKRLEQHSNPGTQVIVIEGDNNFPRIDIASLFFMLGKKGPEILHQIDIQNRRFWTFAAILKSRNEYIEYLQRTEKTNRITVFQHKLLSDRVENMLGAYTVAMDEVKPTMQLLSDFLSKWYPRKQILTMKDIEQKEEELESQLRGN